MLLNPCKIHSKLKIVAYLWGRKSCGVMISRGRETFNWAWGKSWRWTRNIRETPWLNLTLRTNFEIFNRAWGMSWSWSKNMRAGSGLYFIPRTSTITANSISCLLLGRDLVLPNIFPAISISYSQQGTKYFCKTGLLGKCQKYGPQSHIGTFYCFINKKKHNSNFHEWTIAKNENAAVH